MPDPFARGGEISLIYRDMFNIHERYALHTDTTLEQFTVAMLKFTEDNKKYQFACQWADGLASDICELRGWK